MVRTREEAMCRFYLLNFTPENLAEARRRLETLAGYEVCYNKDPNVPLLLHTNDINDHQDQFSRYVPSAAKLTDENLVVRFINTVYRADNPIVNNPDDEGNLDQYCDLFKAYNSDLSFTLWCRTNELNFLEATDDIVVNKESGARVPNPGPIDVRDEWGNARELYVLRPDYHVKSITDIKDLLGIAYIKL